MSTFLVELYLPQPQPADLERVATLACAAAADAGHRDSVRYLQTILLPGDETCFCLFAAASADALCAVQARAGLVPTRVVEALTDAPAPAGAQTPAQGEIP